MVAEYFKIQERGSTVRTEMLGGITTFVAMAYIIVVNPAILSFAGLPVGPSTVATILAALVGSLLMGLYANRPIAVAPYMGENALIVFTYNIGNGLTAGLVLYPVMKILAGRARELNGGAIVLGLLCLVCYLFGLPH